MRIVVVGAGMAGLVAAHRLGEAHDVVVLEATDRAGGKLRTERVAGVTVDVGAEAMLHRRPEGVALAAELGLEIVHPAMAGSRVWLADGLHPLPRSLMGVPLDLDELQASGVLSDEGLARLRAEQPGCPVDDDVSVGDLVASRLGEEVVTRLVEPLLGGVYAGHAHLISAQAAMPQLLALARRGPLLEQAGAMPPPDGSPVFAGLAGGMARLPAALADSGRFEVRTGVTVRELRRGAGGFELVSGATVSPTTWTADAVVLAAPAAPTARLLATLAPEAAEALAAVEYASVAVVTLAFRAADLPDLAGSGFLVPPDQGRAIKASTFSFNKWDWVREAGLGAGPDGADLVLLRTSLGRHREEASLQRTDAELVTASLADLRRAAGVVAEPVDTHVQRWGGGLPQYAVGHVDLVARIRAAVAQVPGLAVAGAAYDGVGIPAVIASALRAAAQVAGGQ